MDQVSREDPRLHRLLAMPGLDFAPVHHARIPHLPGDRLPGRAREPFLLGPREHGIRRAAYRLFAQGPAWRARDAMGDARAQGGLAAVGGGARRRDAESSLEL